MREMAYQALTKGFSQLSPDTAVVLVPFSGVPAAHLPLSHHFCSCGTYLSRTLLDMRSLR